MKFYLHNIGDIYSEAPVIFGDVLLTGPEYCVDYILTNLPFSKKASSLFINEEEVNKIRESICYEQRSLWGTKENFETTLFHIIFNNGNYNQKVDELRLVCNKADKIFYKTLSKICDQDIRVSSFANMEDDYLHIATEMWGHYTQSHCGFCVEYDLKNNIDSYEYQIPLGLLLPCKYSSKGIKISKEYFYKFAMGIEMTKFQQKAFEKSIMKSFLIKSSSWSYENEWRLIVPKDVCDYYDNMLPFFPITKIYLGCKMEQDNKEYMYRLAKRKGFLISDMIASDDSFTLIERPIDIDSYFIERDYYKQQVMNKLQYNTLQKDIYNHAFFNVKK